MPIDPTHGRRYPSGKRLAAVLVRLFRAMGREVVNAFVADRPPELGRYTQVIAQQIQPILAHEWALGAEQIRRELRRYQADIQRGKSFTRKAPASLPPGLNVAWDAFRPEVSAAVQANALHLAGQITADTLRRVRDIIRDGLESGDPVKVMTDNLRALFSPERAMSIGMTESSRAMHAGEAAAIVSSGITDEWEWLASSDACEKCLALNGKRVKVGQPFVIDDRGGPYAVVTSAPRHPHCMCTCKPVIPGAKPRWKR